jgi:hypothetical protein
MGRLHSWDVEQLDNSQLPVDEHDAVDERHGWHERHVQQLLLR